MYVRVGEDSILTKEEESFLPRWTGKSRGNLCEGGGSWTGPWKMKYLPSLPLSSKSPLFTSHALSSKVWGSALGRNWRGWDGWGPLPWAIFFRVIFSSYWPVPHSFKMRAIKYKIFILNCFCLLTAWFLLTGPSVTHSLLSRGDCANKGRKHGTAWRARAFM